MIEFKCPSCASPFRVAAELAGRNARCKKCGNRLVVPSPNAALQSVPTEAALLASTRIIIGVGDLIQFSSHDANATATARGALGAEDKVAASEASSSIGVAPAPRTASGRTSVRSRRLQADAEEMTRAFRQFPLIRVFQTGGDPPELYRVEYRVRGLVRGNGGVLCYRDEHQAEIQLTRDYPRQSPKCKMLTPIFHPNIEPAVICVGDHWTAGERLVDLVVRIGEMIAYQAYNIKSPLDGEAAKWADLNTSSLPVDRRSLRPPELD